MPPCPTAYALALKHLLDTYAGAVVRKMNDDYLAGRPLNRNPENGDDDEDRS